MTFPSRHIARVLAASLALLAACATPAASTGAAATLRAGEIAPDGSVVSCRNVAVTGSRFPIRECKSEQAWAEFDAVMAENAKNETDKFQRVRTGCSTTGTC